MGVCVRLVTTSPEETREVAATVARALELGDVVSLTGELGAGKTCFVQGAAAALGVTDRVTSPSFLLRREYAGRLPLLHFDVYRLDTLAEVADLGWEDALDAAHVTFVEWGDAMAPLLPANHLEVELSMDDAPAADQPDAATAADRPDAATAADQPDAATASERPGDAPAAEQPDAEPRRIVVRPHGDVWRRRLVELAADLAPWRE